MSNNERTFYEVIVQKDDESDDLLIPLPPDMLKKLGWKPGDTIDWSIDANGRWVIKKV